MYGLQLSELFTYLNTFIIFLRKRGLDNRESTVYLVQATFNHY